MKMKALYRLCKFQNLFKTHIVPRKTLNFCKTLLENILSNNNVKLRDQSIDTPTCPLKYVRKSQTDGRL